MNAPDNAALLAAVSRRLLHFSRDLELLARAMRQTLPADVLAGVWAAQRRVHLLAEAAHPNPPGLPSVPESFEE